MKTRVIGKSAHGLPIVAHEFGTTGPEILILGGVHGDEYEGIVAAEGLLSLLQTYPFHLRLTLIPRFNPDGAMFRTRGNGHGVDLNRNLPTKDWSPVVATPRYHPGPSAGSEPENRALMKLLETHNFKFLLSLHSWHPVLNVNGDCLPEAEVLAKWTGYRVDTDIGYPTPGCLGTYTGLERGLPTLTYEIQRGQSAEDVLKIHVPAIREMLKVCEGRFK